MISSWQHDFRRRSIVFAPLRPRVIVAFVNRTGALLAALSALCFATLGIWGKLAQQLGLISSSLLVWRFGLVALVLFALGYGKGFKWAARAQMVGFGLAYFVFTLCYFAAIERISAATASLLVYLAPVVVVVIHWVLGRRPTRAQGWATLLAALGLLIIVGVPSAADADLLGVLFGALAGIGYGGYLVATEHQNVAPLAFTAHGALGTTLGFAVWNGINGTSSLPVSLEAWGLIVAMALISTLLALPMLYMAIHRIGAARASVISTLEPVFAGLLAWLVISETPRVSTMIGAVLVLVAAILATLEASTSAKVNPQSEPITRQKV
jgi:drug/metabolite transporter (DMT)-like permease